MKPRAAGPQPRSKRAASRPRLFQISQRVQTRSCRPLSEVPAQTPFKDGWSRAYSRHSLATGHRAQRTEARRRLEPSGGKKSLHSPTSASRPPMPHRALQQRAQVGRGSRDRIAMATNSCSAWSSHASHLLSIGRHWQSPRFTSGDVAPWTTSPPWLAGSIPRRQTRQTPSLSTVAQRLGTSECRRPGRPLPGAPRANPSAAAFAAPHSRIISSTRPGSTSWLT